MNTYVITTTTDVDTCTQIVKANSPDGALNALMSDGGLDLECCISVSIVRITNDKALETAWTQMLHDGSKL